MFEGPDCDWSGEPGPPPTDDELCQAHVGRTSHLRYKCKHQSKEVRRRTCFGSIFEYLGWLREYKALEHSLVYLS